ncbi:DgyrCDS4139 [Dimorphilus gyrociliatus]|uniref:DgyrCDS4139 n=1 Tax=Dimorphilus gyrociliatus TaxID=2664684 RepID=A0A7I8VGK5_9ANNE|nr:DgyrCDS4139 [Dimorphilus gyrociliatus]
MKTIKNHRNRSITLHLDGIPFDFTSFDDTNLVPGFCKALLRGTEKSSKPTKLTDCFVYGDSNKLQSDLGWSDTTVFRPYSIDISGCHTLDITKVVCIEAASNYSRIMEKMSRIVPIKSV